MGAECLSLGCLSLRRKLLLAWLCLVTTWLESASVWSTTSCRWCVTLGRQKIRTYFNIYSTWVCRVCKTSVRRPVVGFVHDPQILCSFVLTGRRVAVGARRYHRYFGGNLLLLQARFSFCRTTYSTYSKRLLEQFWTIFTGSQLTDWTGEMWHFIQKEE